MPGDGATVPSRNTACRAAFCESRIVTSYSDMKLPAAITVTTAWRQKDWAMIMKVAEWQNCRVAGRKISISILQCRHPASLQSLVVMDDVVNAPAALDEGQRQLIRRRRQKHGAQRR